jgi:YD repeat-containing protein
MAGPGCARDANAHRMTSTYDAAGRLTGREDPLGNRITFTYDAAGRLATRVDGKGRTTTYSYSCNGQSPGRRFCEVVCRRSALNGAFGLGAAGSRAA